MKLFLLSALLVFFCLAGPSASLKCHKCTVLSDTACRDDSYSNVNGQMECSAAETKCYGSIAARGCTNSSICNLSGNTCCDQDFCNGGTAPTAPSQMCYSCTSVGSDDDCSSKNVKTASSVDKIACATKCTKTSVGVGNYDAVTRGCSGVATSCSLNVGGYGTHCCTGNLCNSGKALKSSFAAVLVALSGFRFF